MMSSLSVVVMLALRHLWRGELGVRTLLITHSIDTLGQMSCNPAIGGIGKSHLVREIDALGGVMARATDQAGIQFRVLNARKGRGTCRRVQADRALYRTAIRSALRRPSIWRFFRTPSKILSYLVSVSPVC